MNHPALDFDNPFTERTPRVVAAAKLHRRSARRKAQRFLIEGPNSVDMAIAAGAVSDIFATVEAAEKYGDLLTAASDRGVYVHAITSRAAQHLADTVTSTGLFGLCPLVDNVFDEASRLHGAQLVVVGVDIADPGNAGTLIRLADAFGADAIIFAGNCVDPYSSKVARSSAGSVFNIKLLTQSCPATAIAALREAGMMIAATSPSGDVAITSPEGQRIAAGPVAWLLGNEAHGLDEKIQQLATARISLPITGRAESLNVAAAAAVCLWETAKSATAR